MLYCASCGRHLIGQQNRYRHNFPCSDWIAARRGTPRAHHNATDRRQRGISYPADAFEGIVRQALAHVSANAKLISDVVEKVKSDDGVADAATLARVSLDRDAALAKYRRDRDLSALE